MLADTCVYGNFEASHFRLIVWLMTNMYILYPHPYPKPYLLLEKSMLQLPEQFHVPFYTNRIKIIPSLHLCTTKCYVVIAKLAIIHGYQLLDCAQYDRMCVGLG